MAVGTIYTELALDTTKFKKAQENLLHDIKNVGANVENSLQQAFSNLGVKTDNIYQLMVNLDANYKLTILRK